MWKTWRVLHKTVDKLNISEDLNIYMWISIVHYKMSFPDGKMNIIKGQLDTKGPTCSIEKRMFYRLGYCFI